MPTIEINSMFTGSDRPRVVTVDAYTPNPLADEVHALWPTEYAIATRINGPAPRMFLAGTADVPVFTASGFEPASLLVLPYRTRHYVSAEPSIAVAQAQFERFIGDPFAHVEHEGLSKAIARLNEWLIVPADQMTPEEAEALYLNIYGASDAVKPPPPAPLPPRHAPSRW